jgi:type II secretory pathway pseudopilin PulG
MAGIATPIRFRGLTLLETLMVIAIVAVLTGLLLPAIQRIRAAAQATECRNNLHQIGIALHGYHHGHGHLPPAYIFDEQYEPDPWVTFNTYPGWGWAAHILPLLEQSAVADQLQWDKAVEDDDMTWVRSQILTVFVCPADTGAGMMGVFSERNKPMCDAASTSYAACYGFSGPIGEQPTLGNGIFYRNSRTRFEDIHDGPSTTLAVGERAALFCPTPWAGAVSDGTVRTNVNSPSFLAAVEEAPVMVMARTNPYPLNQDYSSPYDFYSPHPTSGMFLFADGSVRALRFDMSLDVWRAIATRDGGESVSESDF